MVVPTNLALDDRLIREAVVAGRHKTKKDAVDTALREYIQSCKRLRILDWVGKVDYYEDYDHKKHRSRKLR